MEKLRRLRTERGLSQAKLAARAELDPSTVNQIERGAREASPATLRKLAEALDVGIAELLEDASPKAQRRSSLEPSLFNGLEAERRISINYTACRDALQDFCGHWEGVLREDSPDRRALHDFEAAAACLSRLMLELMGAEKAELGPQGQTEEPKFYSERSVLWPAIDRYISLGIRMDRLSKERFGEDLAAGAEVIELRDYASRKAG